jgi:dipeptidyl aminopeptidase/acylaminoacyl peptidase
MIRQALIAAALMWTLPVAAEPTKPFQPEDLFSIVLAKNPAVNPDGRTVAYVRETADIQTDDIVKSLWLADVASGASRQIGADPGQQSGPVWSPDGRTLAYVATRKDTRPRLMAFDPATGKARLIVELPEKPSKIAWSPDGKTIAYTAFVAGKAPRLGTALKKPEGAKWAEPLKIYQRLRWQTDDDGVLKFGAAQVFTVPAAGGTPRQVTEGDHPLGSLAFAKDGQSLIATSNRDDDPDHNPEGADLWRIPLDGGPPQRLLARDGDDEAVTVSPDGTRVAWIGTAPSAEGWRTPRLWVANSDGSNPRAVTAALDAPVASPRWDADGRSLLAQIGERGRQVLARISLDGKVERLTDALGGDSLDRPYSSGAFAVGGGTIAFTTSDATHPGDLATLAQGKPRLLTDLGADLRTNRALATIRPLKVISKRDGATIDAWVALPPGYKPGQRLPTILEVHGGPAAAYGPTFATDMQLYTAAGYAVVYPNARNSTSYGEAFANWTRLDIPFSEFEDWMGTLDAAIAEGFADPDNLFVTGGSYGGYASAALVGLTHRFRAAAAQKPVIDWNSKMLTTDIAYQQSFMTYDAPPWEKPLETWRNSPISLVGNVTTPTLLLVGSEDRRTPPSQALEFYTALSLRKVPTELVIVPGANHHGFAGRPSQSAARVSAILAWFDRYRKR